LADGFSSDIISFSIDGVQCYVRIQSQGILKNNDFCYYLGDEYIEEVSRVFLRFLGHLEIYTNLEIIDLSFDSMFTSEKKLYILKNKIEFEGAYVKEKYKLIFAVNASSFGLIHTLDLQETDNKWIRQNQMELLLLANIDICEMRIFGIKGKTTSEEIEKIRMKISELNKSGESWDPYFSELYKRKIIMIGFCSC
jgi:hypothetical protein